MVLRWRRRPRCWLAVWAALLVMAAVPVVLRASHAASGGGAHPRYLFAMLPIVACAVAILVRMVHRALPAFVVAGLAVRGLTEVARVGAERSEEAWSNPTVPLAGTVGGPVAQTASLVVAGCGGVALVIALAVLASRRTAT